MQIDFNHVRILAANAYNSLQQKLEQLPPSEKEYLINDMDNLKMYLGSICWTYEEGNENFKDLGDVVKLNELTLQNHDK